MARPRKSAESKLLSGTYRRDRSAPKTTATRLERIPAPPKYLSTAAKKEWRRLAPAVKGTGSMTAGDLVALELLCRTLATATKAEETIEKEGITIAAANGGEKPNPALAMMATARGQAAALLAQFGLTPRGRAGIAPAPAEKKNRFSAVRK